MIGEVTDSLAWFIVAVSCAGPYVWFGWKNSFYTPPIWRGDTTSITTARGMPRGLFNHPCLSRMQVKLLSIQSHAVICFDWLTSGRMAAGSMTGFGIAGGYSLFISAFTAWLAPC
jgi:hypothetical protein